MTQTDALSLRMQLQSADFVRGSRTVIGSLQNIAKSALYARASTDGYETKLKNTTKEMDSATKTQMELNQQMVSYASKAAIAMTATMVLYREISRATKAAGKMQTTLVDINNSLGNFGATNARQRIDATTKAVMRQASGITSLSTAAKAYYTIATAGMAGTTRGGKDITELGVKYAKYYQVLSRGKISMEQAAGFMPELIAKTGANLDIVYNNGSTAMERYIDMMGKAERISRLKMENMRDVMDAMGASMRQMGVSFEDALGMVAVQMNAGQSSRTAGQTVKSILTKMTADAAQLRAHTLQYDPAGKDAKRLQDLTRGLLATKGFSEATNKLFGSKSNFDMMTMQVMDGTISLENVFKTMEKNAGKLEKSQVGAFNKMTNYFTQVSRLGEGEVTGTRQQKRLLFALSMLYGDKNKAVTSRENIQTGRQAYLDVIGQVKTGQLSMLSWFKDLETRMQDRYGSAGTVEGKRAIIEIVRMLFPDQVAGTGFLNVLQHRTIQLVDDVYDTFSDGTRKLLKDLSKVEQERAISEGRVKNGQVLLGRQGQRVSGAEAAIMMSYAIKDSGQLAKANYDRIMKTYEKQGERLKAQIESFRILVGEGFLAPFTTLIKGTASALEALNSAMMASNGLRTLISSLGGAATVMGAIYTGGMAIKIGGNLKSRLTGVVPRSAEQINMDKELAKAVRTGDTQAATMLRQQGAKDTRKNAMKLEKEAAATVAEQRKADNRLRKEQISTAKLRIKNARSELKNYQANNAEYLRLSRTQSAIRNSIRTYDSSSPYKQAGINLRSPFYKMTQEQKLAESTRLLSQRRFIDATQQKAMIAEQKKLIRATRLSRINRLKSNMRNFSVTGAISNGYNNLMGSPGAMITTLGLAGLLSWGFRGMLKNNMFGLQSLTGRADDGFSGPIKGLFTQYRTADDIRMGKKISYDTVGKGITNHKEYTKYQALLKTSKDNNTKFLETLLTPLLKNEIGGLVRLGQTTEGAAYDNFFSGLVGGIETGVHGGKITKDMLNTLAMTNPANDTKRAGAVSEVMAFLGTISKNEKQLKGWEEILNNKDNSQAFINARDQYDDAVTSFADFKKMYGEELAKQKDPILYGIYKSIGAMMPWVYSIAMGVGVGGIAGKLGKGLNSVQTAITSALLGANMVSYSSLMSSNAPDKQKMLAAGFSALLAAAGGIGVGMLTGNPVTGIQTALGINAVSTAIGGKLVEENELERRAKLNIGSLNKYVENNSGIKYMEVEKRGKNFYAKRGKDDWVQLDYYLNSQHIAGKNVPVGMVDGISGKSYYTAQDSILDLKKQYEIELEIEKDKLRQTTTTKLLNGGYDSSIDTNVAEYAPTDYISDTFIEAANATQKNTMGLEALNNTLKDMEDVWYFDMNTSGYEKSRVPMKGGESFINLGKTRGAAEHMMTGVYANTPINKWNIMVNMKQTNGFDAAANKNPHVYMTGATAGF